MGSTVENEEKIRRITYSRQYHRYKEAEQEQKEQETSRDVSQQNVEQQTSSKDENNEQYEGKNKDIERRMTHDKSKTVGLVVAPGVTALQKISYKKCLKCYLHIMIISKNGF